MPSQLRCAQQLSQRESLWRNRKLCRECEGLSLWERWHRVSDDGEGKPAEERASQLKRKIIRDKISRGSNRS